MRRPRAYTDAHRAADAHAPALARGLISALRSVATERVTHTALAEGYAGGTVSHAVHAIDWNGLEDDLLHAIQPLLLATVARTSRALVQKALDPTISAALSYGFDITNPRAVTWAQKYAATLALNLSAEAHQAVRSMVVTMFEQGVPPQAAARRIRAMIGLDRRYATAVLNYQQGLVAKGTIPQNVVTELVDQYSQSLIKQRATTIARTESLRAAVKGQQLLWQEQIDKGILSADRVRQVWLVTPDDRLCFTGATPIATPTGDRPIEELGIGDEVISHLGVRRVIGITRQDTTIRTVKVCAGDWCVWATIDHPYLVRRGDRFQWVGAGLLQVGDEVCQYVTQRRNGSVGGDGAFLETDNVPLSGDEPLGFSGIPRFITVPVRAVHLKGHPTLTQEEVDTIATHLCLLGEWDAERLQSFADGSFQFVLPTEPAIAGEGTELTGVSRADAAALTAMPATPVHWRASALLGTIAPHSAVVREPLATTGTVAVFGGNPPAPDGADGVPVGDDPLYRERITTRGAGLGDCLGTVGGKVTGSPTETSPVANAFMVGAVGLPAMTASGAGAVNLLGGVIARTGAEAALLPDEWLGTPETMEPVWSHETTYSIEVQGASTFIAGGILVHNCPVCASIPSGRDVFSGDSPDNQPPVGGLFYVPATGEYIDGPPQHPSCRCDVTLLVANSDGTFPEPKSLFAEVLAYAGADGPPAARVLQPRVPLRYR